MRLDEVEFTEKTELGERLRPYIGKMCYVHFSKTNKMGINPKKSHRDPYGVYAYGLDWLFSSKHFHDGELYGVDWPYVTIFRLEYNPDGIQNLGQMTWEYAEEIANRNGWLPEWQEISISKAGRNCGDTFWNTVINLKDRVDLHMSSNRALKGIPYIHDTSGIIHHRERDQVVVFDPRTIRVMDHFTNTWSPRFKPDGINPKYMSQPTGENYHFISKLFRDIRGDFGGNLVWRQQRPVLTFDHGGASFKLEYRANWTPYLILECRFLRARREITIDKLREQSYDEIKRKIVNEVNVTATLQKKGKDIFFDPMLSEANCKTTLRALVNIPERQFSVEIDNHRKEFTMTAETTFVEDSNEIITIAWVSSPSISSDEDPRIGRSIQVNNSKVLSQYGRLDLKKARDLMRENFEQHIASVKPDSDAGWRFYFEEDYKAFVGWLAKNCSVPDFEAEFAEEIRFYDSLNDKRKREVHKDINRAFR